MDSSSPSSNESLTLPSFLFFFFFFSSLRAVGPLCQCAGRVFETWGTTEWRLTLVLQLRQLPCGLVLLVFHVFPGRWESSDVVTLHNKRP